MIARISLYDSQLAIHLAAFQSWYIYRTQGIKKPLLCTINCAMFKKITHILCLKLFFALLFKLFW